MSQDAGVGAGAVDDPIFEEIFGEEVLAQGAAVASGPPALADTVGSGVIELDVDPSMNDPLAAESPTTATPVSGKKRTFKGTPTDEKKPVEAAKPKKPSRFSGIQPADIGKQALLVLMAGAIFFLVFVWVLSGSAEELKLERPDILIVYFGPFFLSFLCYGFGASFVLREDHLLPAYGGPNWSWRKLFAYWGIVFGSWIFSAIAICMAGRFYTPGDPMSFGIGLLAALPVIAAGAWGTYVGQRQHPFHQWADLYTGLNPGKDEAREAARREKAAAAEAKRREKRLKKEAAANAKTAAKAAKAQAKKPPKAAGKK